MRRSILFALLVGLLLIGLCAQESGSTESGSPATAPATTAAPATTPATTAEPATTPAPAPEEGVQPSPAAAETAVPELEALQARTRELEAELASLGAKLEASEADYARIQGLLEEERAARAEEAAAAETFQADLFAAAETAGAEREELEGRLAALEAESKGALAERDELALKIAQLELEREALGTTGGLGAIDASAYPVLLLSGFAEAKARIGLWKIEGDSASQLEGREFFSRLEIPLEQAEQPYLYRFRASASGKGWVGLGLHLFGSNVKSRRGYGEGRSLLVWLTRDPKVRKTDATWLQLYRSDNDVVMERVVDAKLEEAVGESLYFEILYDPGTGYLKVQIDGRLVLSYRAFFGIEKGVGIAFRSLGAGASFSDFEVRRAK